jgi:hypothetical protein
MGNTIELIKGQPYMVKHRGSLKSTRRVYRGEEIGVCNIKRYVFSSKVKREYLQKSKKRKIKKEIKRAYVFSHGRTHNQYHAKKYLFLTMI